MKKLSLLLFLILIFTYSNISAQNQIESEKLTALKEIVSLVNQDNKSETIAKTMMNQIDSVRNLTVQSIIDERNDLSSTQKKELEKVLIEDANRMSKRFQTEIFQKINFNQITEEIMIEIYDKYYSLEELKDLLVFYKTPTGQKTLKITQPLMEDSMRLTQERIVPKLLTAVQEIIESERTELRKKSNEKNPRKSNHR